jgi:uncharacterized protein YeaO (DUF488 family)
MAAIRTRRVYDEPAPDDSVRVLVDRIWPRGVSRERAAVALWLKDVAPSTALRQWFGHDPARWDGFRQRYFAELDAMPEVVAQLRAAAAGGTLTLVYSARDTGCNQAVALSEYLQRRAPAAPPAPPSAPPRRSRPGAGSATAARRPPRR